MTEININKRKRRDKQRRSYILSTLVENLNLVGNDPQSIFVHGENNMIKIRKESLENIFRQLPFVCPICGMSFKGQEKLSEHQYYDCTGGW